MAVDEFKGNVTWGADEPLDTDKLNAMSGNTQFLYDRAPKMRFTSYGGATQDTGIKIACGVVMIPAQKRNWVYVKQSFGDFFTPGCKPIITTGVASYLNGRVMIVFHHLNLGENYIPDYQGVEFKASLREYDEKNNYFYKSLYINWMAMGY